jgi:uncharacterized damage-inducible protein DinB
MMTEHFRRMARYNRWMNEKLYAICATMSDDERKQERTVPFRSIHGVLNHLLLADRVWLGRFNDQPFIVSSLEQELFSDFDELRGERDLTDDAIDRWGMTLTEAVLAAPFTFTSITNPVRRTMPLWQAAQHFFNHQTHHRGQLTALIELAGYDCGVTDLLVLPEAE